MNIASSDVLFTLAFSSLNLIDSSHLWFSMICSSLNWLCVYKRSSALLFRRRSKDVWWLPKFRAESIHFKWSTLIEVQLLPEFNQELKELKSELLSVGTSYEEVRFDKLRFKLDAKKSCHKFFVKFPTNISIHCTLNVGIIAGQSFCNV